MSGEARNKRARIDEDQWKRDLRDWLSEPGRMLGDDTFDVRGENEYAGWYIYLEYPMIERLLELPAEDSASDAAFDAFMKCPGFADEGDDLMIRLGLQVDFDYSGSSEGNMPYLKRFLTEIPVAMKKLRMEIHLPEVIKAFPDNIGGTDGSALEEIALFYKKEFDDTSENESTKTQFLASLENMLYLTRNIENVSLKGFGPSNSRDKMRSFKSQTKTMTVWSPIVAGKPSMHLHPDTTYCSMQRLKICCHETLENLEEARLVWRPWFKVSCQTLTTIELSLDKEHFLQGMCDEVANQTLENLETIKLSFIRARLDPLSHLASSRVGSRLKRLELSKMLQEQFVLSLAPTIASFENLEELAIDFYLCHHQPSNLFLQEYLKLQPSSLRHIDLSEIDLSDTSFEALFSTKSLESIKFTSSCREFFIGYKHPFSSNLCTLDISAVHIYDTEQILRVLAVLPDLRCLKINLCANEANFLDDETVQRIIANGIARHGKLCLFECGLWRGGRLSTQDRNTAFNQATRLPCLRNRFNASEKQLPLGFIPNVIVRSEELCKESGIFQFLKEEYPVYIHMGS